MQFDLAPRRRLAADVEIACKADNLSLSETKS